MLPASAGLKPLASSLKPELDHPLVSEIRKRFAADVIRREPVDRHAWLAKLRRESGGPADADPA